MDYKMIGQKIKEARKDAKLTQQQLADLVETAKSVISEYESGARIPTIPNLDKISIALNRDLRIELDRKEP